VHDSQGTSYCQYGSLNWPLLIKSKNQVKKGYPKNSLKKVASITYHIAFGLLEHLLWFAPTTHHIAFIISELIFPLIYHLMWSSLL